MDQVAKNHRRETVRLGRASYKLRDGHSGTVTVKLTAAAIKLIAACHNKLAVSVTTTITGVKAVSKRLTLR